MDRDTVEREINLAFIALEDGVIDEEECRLRCIAIYNEIC